MTRNEYIALILRDDAVGARAVGKALVHLFRRQTEDEQASNDTRHHNMRGFTGADARRGSITAKYFLKHGELLDWQLEYWRAPNRRGVPRLGKYYGQIAEEAQRKATA
jgi:hypothetical protein